MTTKVSTKIYTRTGDDGTTGLFGGRRVSKSELRIHAYGTVDELNSGLGHLRSLFSELQNQEALKPEQAAALSTQMDLVEQIQNRLFDVGSRLATPEGPLLSSLPRIEESDIQILEDNIDLMSQVLPTLTQFILPGGHMLSSLSHLARTTTRRAERLCVELSLTEPIDPILVQYLNRLSDYLFVLSRYFNFITKTAETHWKKR